MIKLALLFVAACTVETAPPDPVDESLALDMAAACCHCDAAPYIYPPDSIHVGFPIEIPTDSSGGCSSYKGQAGNAGLGNHMSYHSDGLHDCFAEPMPRGGCPQTWTPEATKISWPTDD